MCSVESRYLMCSMWNIVDVRRALLDVGGQKLLTSRENLCGFRWNLCYFLVAEVLTPQVVLQTTGDFFFLCLIWLLRQKMVWKASALLSWLLLVLFLPFPSTLSYLVSSRHPSWTGTSRVWWMVWVPKCSGPTMPPSPCRSSSKHSLTVSYWQCSWYFWLQCEGSGLGDVRPLLWDP